MNSRSAITWSVTEPEDEYAYTNITKQQLRLLDLYPAQHRSNPIICNLRTVNFADLDHHPYDALSYCWGTSEETQEIFLTFKSSKPGDVDHAEHDPQANSWADALGPSGELRDRSRKTFHITQNLETALRYFRNDTKNVTLWVDAICINQDDEQEKGQEVARIAEIFHQAHAVRIWLGESDADTEGIAKFIEETLDLQKLEKAVSNPEASPKRWYQLSQLMRRDWFRRRWVIQELALAKEAYLHVGDEVLLWDHFAEAVALFRQEAGRIEAMTERAPENPARRIGNVRFSGAFSIIEMTNNLFRWSGTARAGRPLEDAEPLTSLKELVSRLVMFNATDPRDTIFAMLSLAKDIPSSFHTRLPSSSAKFRKFSIAEEAGGLLFAEYTSNVLEVFKDFVALCTGSGSLDIICRHWAPNKLPPNPSPDERSALMKDPNQFRKSIEVELPSWIPLQKDSAFTTPTNSLSGIRRQADDPVGLPGQRQYDAAKGTEADIRSGEVDFKEQQPGWGGARNHLYETKILKWTEHDHKASSLGTLLGGRRRRSNGCLIAKGFIAGRIRVLSNRLQDAVITSEALGLSGWTSKMEHDSWAPDKIWRTFVADRARRGNNPPLWYRRALLTCITLRDSNDRIEAVLWNKRLMTLKTNISHVEQFGIAPPQAEVGDLICVLLGCSVPVVLRQHNTEAGTCYQLIGEAYCYNLMEGEALSQYGHLSDEQLKELPECIDFRLR